MDQRDLSSLQLDKRDRERELRKEVRVAWTKARREQVMDSKVAGSAVGWCRNLVESRDLEALMEIGQLTQENLEFLDLACKKEQQIT